MTLFFKNARTAWDTKWITRTTKTRTQLRHQTTIVEGRSMKVMNYIDIVAQGMVYVCLRGKAVDHREMLREIYYKYDLAGLNYYVKRIMKRNRREAKRIAKLITPER